MSGISLVQVSLCRCDLFVEAVKAEKCSMGVNFGTVASVT